MDGDGVVETTAEAMAQYRRWAPVLLQTLRSTWKLSAGGNPAGGNPAGGSPDKRNEFSGGAGVAVDDRGGRRPVLIANAAGANDDPLLDGVAIERLENLVQGRKKRPTQEEIIKRAHEQNQPILQHSLAHSRRKDESGGSVPPEQVPTFPPLCVTTFPPPCITTFPPLVDQCSLSRYTHS